MRESIPRPFLKRTCSDWEKNWGILCNCSSVSWYNRVLDFTCLTACLVTQLLIPLHPKGPSLLLDVTLHWGLVGGGVPLEGVFQN